MDILRSVLVILHLLSWAVVFGAALAGLRQRVMPAGLLHGAVSALVTGILLVGVLEMGDYDVNHVKIGIKLVVALVVTGLVFWGNRKDELDKAFFGSVAGLTAVNVAIAVLV
ncbi:hypothetical protein [Flaviflexus huanghaiensis]|uniref:hypothetical protein n=1 Tax=Flaviflexus huanghaiensis TaxID=1111473 RepID=UPI0015F9FCD5|nr:hypothetical protein [Flaviflexus huanghaiensis]